MSLSWFARVRGIVPRTGRMIAVDLRLEGAGVQIPVSRAVSGFELEVRAKNSRRERRTISAPVLV